MDDTLLMVKYMISADPELKDAKIFDVSSDIWSFAEDCVIDRLPEDDAGVPHEALPTPQSSIPPADKSILVYGRGAFIAHRHNEEVVCGFLSADGLHLLGGYIPGRPCTVTNLCWKEAGPNTCATLVDLVAFTLAIVNEPRVVNLSAGITRQQRRAAQRGFGFAVDAYTKVTWDLSKPCVAKTARDPDFHSMPLHWCRGHFRRAGRNFAGAVRRPDAFREEDRDLWWQWIDGYWRGHPAFGVKKSIHAPKLSSGFFAKRRSAAA